MRSVRSGNDAGEDLLVSQRKSTPGSIMCMWLPEIFDRHESEAGTSVSSQHFSQAPGGAPLATVNWQDQFTNIELVYQNTLLTRIASADALRTTGMQGHAPDGSALVLHVVNGPTGEQFSLTHNGIALYSTGPVVGGASPTLFAPPAATGSPSELPAPPDAHLPTGGYPPPAGSPAPVQGGYPPPQQGGYPPPPQQGGYPPPQQGGYPPPQQGGYPPPQQGYAPPGGYPQQGAVPGYGNPYAANSPWVRQPMSGPTAANEKIMKTARIFLTVVSVLAVIVGLYVLSLVDEVEAESQGAIRAVAIIVLVIGVLYFVIGRMAKGPRAKSLFLVASIVTGINALLNVINIAQNAGSGLVGTIIAVALAFSCMRAYKAARESYP
jgi:hypothetical protein